MIERLAIALLSKPDLPLNTISSVRVETGRRRDQISFVVSPDFPVEYGIMGGFFKFNTTHKFAEALLWLLSQKEFEGVEVEELSRVGLINVEKSPPLVEGYRIGFEQLYVIGLYGNGFELSNGNVIPFFVSPRYTAAKATGGKYGRR